MISHGDGRRLLGCSAIFQRTGQQGPSAEAAGTSQLLEVVHPERRETQPPILTGPRVATQEDRMISLGDGRRLLG